MKNPETCSVCKKLYFKNPYDINNTCSECQTDEALHSYLQALRRKDSKLSLLEWLFLSIKS